MSVIGRLDPQVEDVLISPLDVRRPAVEKVPPAARPDGHDEPPHVGDDAGEDESPRGRAELPVWLL